MEKLGYANISMWHICCTQQITIAAVTLTIADKDQAIQNSRKKKWVSGPQGCCEIATHLANEFWSSMA